jgi:hypothetical protein
VLTNQKFALWKFCENSSLVWKNGKGGSGSRDIFLLNQKIPCYVCRGGESQPQGDHSILSVWCTGTWCLCLFTEMQFAVAWWIWIDGNVFSVHFNNDVPVLFVHYLPGIFGSIALVM